MCLCCCLATVRSQMCIGVCVQEVGGFVVFCTSILQGTVQPRCLSEVVTNAPYAVCMVHVALALVLV